MTADENDPKTPLALWEHFTLTEVIAEGNTYTLTHDEGNNRSGYSIGWIVTIRKDDRLPAPHPGERISILTDRGNRILRVIIGEREYPSWSVSGN